MTGICVGAMFLDDLVVCCEERSKWESFGLGFPLGANDNLVEETDICGSRTRSETRSCISIARANATYHHPRATSSLRSRRVAGKLSEASKIRDLKRACRIWIIEPTDQVDHREGGKVAVGQDMREVQPTIQVIETAKVEDKSTSFTAARVVLVIATETCQGARDR